MGRRASRWSELLIALTIALVVAAGVVKLADDARVFFLVQPEVMDMTRRARAGVDLLIAELASAGAGASLGSGAGPLIRWIPPVIPSRYQGSGGSIPGIGVHGSRDTRDGHRGRAARGSSRGDGGSRGGSADRGAGGLSRRRRRVWLPRWPAYRGVRSRGRLRPRDRARSRRVAGPPFGSALLLHDPSTVAKAFREEDDARVVEVRAVTYYFDGTRNQLRRVTGPRADAPVLDDVVGLSLRYFGERAPPASPRPAAGAANCLFDDDGVPLLPVAAAGRWRSGGADGRAAD